MSGRYKLIICWIIIIAVIVFCFSQFSVVP